ncbi:MAG TPA: type III-A CRISPR-associated RAMP protein Csm5, partial [Candidatus Ozemobacteraceae bacterium]|nr:type III-A CRISPR-associated RAMP protein Csm5 [Candidatus Ozemobacteraceae bacterium]
VDVAAGLVETYRRVLSMNAFDKRAVINNFMLNRVSFVPGSNEPYVPGTSLKGAIRTALLSKIARDAKPPVVNWRDRAGQLEDKLVEREGRNHFESDPFRLVKVSDFHAVGKVATRIVYAINRKKAPTNRPAREQTGPQQIFEVIQPGAIFEGSLAIHPLVPGAGIHHPLDRATLFESLNTYFNIKLEQEIKTMKGIGCNPLVINIINRDFKGKLTKTAFLTRMGRHSGAECVTIDGNRKIRIMQGPGRPPRYDQQATTIWLSADQPRPNDVKTSEPFGWCVLEVV